MKPDRADIRRNVLKGLDVLGAHSALASPVNAAASRIFPRFRCLTGRAPSDLLYSSGYGALAALRDRVAASVTQRGERWLRCNAFWRHRTSLKLIVRYFRSSGHLVASLGLAIRLNRDWLPHLRPKTGGGCTLGLRLGFNDLSLFRIRHYSAHHSRNYAYCYSLFRQVL